MRPILRAVITSVLTILTISYPHRLLNAGRLMGRRENRELDELNAQITTLEEQLEEARAATASAAALTTTSGGAAVKQLQKEVSELKRKVRRVLAMPARESAG